MAVKVESPIGIRLETPALKPQPRASAGPLSREQRLAQARRRRRVTRFQAALEGALWIGGSGALITIGVAGLFGLR